MTCRHERGDRSCTTQYPIYTDHTTSESEKSKTPDSKKFEIIEVIDSYLPYLILKIKYPNCKKCSYEGTKIIVYENITLKDLIYWREIDPHFSDTPKNSIHYDKTKAPSPIARFPASGKGITHATIFVESLLAKEKRINGLLK